MPEKKNAFDSEELKEVFDLCISCKGCASECPSNVDVAVLKAEFDYQYQQVHGISLQTKLFAYSTQINRWASRFPALTNTVFQNPLSSRFIKAISGIALKRSLPRIQPFKIPENNTSVSNGKKVILFIDEFTQYLDGSIGDDAYTLLSGLGYQVELLTGFDSGRAFIAKGLLKQARTCADKLLQELEQLAIDKTPILGIEPSAMLSIRDEYLRLATDKTLAKRMAKQALLIEEFIHQEIEEGVIIPSHFTTEAKALKLHGHCHQKALSSIAHTFAILNLPKNYTPTIIPSGCCGMAGSFGYTKKNYKISMKIGEQTLFPAIEKSDTNVVIVANGTSCRHQIKDGANRKAVHPVTVLRNALLPIHEHKR